MVGQKNHVRIAMRYYTKGAGTTQTSTQFADSILFEAEDSDANRLADTSPTFTKYLTTGIHTEIVTIPSTAQAGLAEIQWIWASERDGAGGYYITCADVQITGAVVDTPTSPPTPSPTPDPASPTGPPSEYTGSGVYCYDTALDLSSPRQILCPDAGDNRCMTTYVNGNYYFRCASETYCLDAKLSSATEGIPEDGDPFTSGLTYTECCKSNNCNTKAIVTIPGQPSKASRSTASVAFLLGTLALLF